MSGCAYQHHLHPEVFQLRKSTVLASITSLCNNCSLWCYCVSVKVIVTIWAILLGFVKICYIETEGFPTLLAYHSHLVLFEQRVVLCFCMTLGTLRTVSCIEA